MTRPTIAPTWRPAAAAAVLAALDALRPQLEELAARTDLATLPDGLVPTLGELASHEVRRAVVLALLEHHQWNLARAAVAAGISPTNAPKYLRALDLTAPLEAARGKGLARGGRPRRAEGPAPATKAPAASKRAKPATRPRAGRKGRPR